MMKRPAGLEAEEVIEGCHACDLGRGGDVEELSDGVELVGGEVAEMFLDLVQD